MRSRNWIRDSRSRRSHDCWKLSCCDGHSPSSRHQQQPITGPSKKSSEQSERFQGPSQKGGGMAGRGRGTTTARADGQLQCLWTDDSLPETRASKPGPSQTVGGVSICDTPPSPKISHSPPPFCKEAGDVTAEIAFRNVPLSTAVQAAPAATLPRKTATVGLKIRQASTTQRNMSCVVAVSSRKPQISPSTENPSTGRRIHLNIHVRVPSSV